VVSAQGHRERPAVASAGRFFMGANQRAEYFSKGQRHRTRV